MHSYDSLKQFLLYLSKIFLHSLTVEHGKICICVFDAEFAAASEKALPCR